jgi:hypothetical protein
MSEPAAEENIGICSYCRRKLKMHDEHVVPRSLFINKDLANIIIPACRDCNDRKARGEGDLRDWMIIRVGPAGHPDIEPLMHEMAAAFGKNTSKIAKAVDEESKLTVRRRKSGILERAY